MSAQTDVRITASDLATDEVIEAPSSPSRTGSAVTRWLDGTPLAEAMALPEPPLPLPRPQPLPRPRRGWLWRVAATWPYLAVAALATLVRIVWPASSDVFGDEVYYIDLSTSVRRGHYPPHFQGQGVFLLHPPLFFIVGAAWEALTGVSGDYFTLVHSMRLLVALFAVATALFVALLTTRIADWRWGLAAGVLFAIEPYALRTNGRVLLETPALAFVLAGYLVLLGRRQSGTRGAGAGSAARPASGESHTSTGRASHPALRAVIGGFVLGLGIVTVEFAAIITIGPLLVISWRRWCLERRHSVLALAAAMTPYVVYLVSLAATHHLAAFVAQDSYGLRRALGLLKETGFSAPGAPSLVSTLIGQVSSFGTTYVLVALGVVYGIYPLLRGSEEFRLIGTIVLFGALAIGYEAALGTIEEQFLYVLLVPAIVSIACACSGLWRRQRRPGRNRRVLAGLLAVLFVAIPLYDVGVWAHNRLRPDDGLAEVVAYLKGHSAADAAVGTNVLVATYVLGHEHIDSLTVSTPRAAARRHVEYFVVLSAELQPGYGAIDAAEARTYERHGQLVFAMQEATYGRVLVYRTTDSAAW